MAKIQRLDAHLTNMIAAGEVVERPMGVVKELIENSIDANAKNIEIHIKQGGLEEILIIDDGDGMSAQDASMAFERHATSKIKEVNDLWKIGTMGFRGEALPSIASVSHVHLKTNDGVDSTEIEIAYGKLKKAGPIGSKKGTSISIKNLFQKMPARLKHLKTPPYEFSLISDVVSKFALSRSDIAFELTHDGKTVFSSKGRGNTLEVIMEMYGRDCAKAAIEIKAEDEDYKINGYAIQPSITRASKYYMLVYINKRMIRSFRLQKAILEAYEAYLPKDRYPIVIIDVEMDPKLVDVNVHPSKWEVRLSKERQLEKLITDSIKNSLQNKLVVNKVERKEKEVLIRPTFDFTYKQEENSVVEPLVKVIREEFKEYDKESSSVLPVVEEVKKQTITEEKTVENKVVKETVYEEKPKVEMSINPSFPYMHVIGQLHKCYILCQGEKGLYIVDQHAAQERYHFEVISQMINKGIKETQPLLLPLKIETTLSAVTRADELNSLLKEVGITLEVFGNHTFIVREIPLWMANSEEEKVLSDLIDYYLKNNEISIEKLRKHTIATMACHTSIRFNRTLTYAEMVQVIEDLKKCEQPFHCPHGRPTFIELTLKELEKDFYRVK